MQTSVPATRYKPYTQEDDDRLVVYLSTHNVRTGSSTPYKSIVLNEDGTSPWGAERTWAGWRSRYAHHKQSFDRKIEAYRRRHGIAMPTEPQPLEPNLDVLLTMSTTSIGTHGPSTSPSSQSLYSSPMLSPSSTRNIMSTASQASTSKSPSDAHFASIVNRAIEVFTPQNHGKTASRSEKLELSPPSPSSKLKNPPQSISGGPRVLAQHASSASPSRAIKLSGTPEVLDDTSMSTFYEQEDSTPAPSHALPARMARKRKRALDYTSTPDTPTTPDHLPSFEDICPGPSKSARMAMPDIESSSSHQEPPPPLRSESGPRTDSYPPRSPSPSSVTSASALLTGYEDSLSQFPEEFDYPSMDSPNEHEPSDPTTGNMLLKELNDDAETKPNDHTESQSSNVGTSVETDDPENDIGSDYESETRTSSAALSASGVGWGGLGHLLGFGA
ncbi:hypothetical protein K435DRAFT_973237 [Dendrothele bispora CBS 962.96]|uniref:Rap1 Myb domain-containing protein n=1 Tax=Dendrothele bispora (strain CBS 962.96) TaxID=1314807 RepID=A0A4S8KU30_DENBC|nr:hypothetical protein K435DRAFT_973237 [Dendrothele bispora CBS 962.96]